MEETPAWLRRVSSWPAGGPPTVRGLDEIGEVTGIPWFEIACGVEDADVVLATLGEHCPGLTATMIANLVTPDDAPTRVPFAGGAIRLASTFGVTTIRDEVCATERGTPRGIGRLVFQPVEILASADWVVSCWHPTRTFAGTEKIDEGPPGAADDLFGDVAEGWCKRSGGSAGDLGVMIMHELALTYVPAQREVVRWAEDWELGLYRPDQEADEENLQELWSLMAVLRDWLNPLNRAGMRKDIGKAWLPATDHAAVIEVDERIDRALAGLARLSEMLRQCFGLLHVAQAEEQRDRQDRRDRRLETLATAFLVPTLVVGFYGANTWIPGQNKHWGFYVMVGLLLVLTLATALLLQAPRRRRAAADRRVESAKLRNSIRS